MFDGFRSARGAPSPWAGHEPIREELFSVERLETHARSLAEAQAIELRRAPTTSLAARLADNGIALRAAYDSISSAVDGGESLTPAAEWLLDNYHLVEKQIRDVRSDLPARYYRELPKLADGPLAGYPRIFGIAWALVAHSDSRFDGEALRRFIAAYQEVQTLKIGELWALSITLRIVLVENLRRLADLMIKRGEDRRAADLVADKLLGANGKTPVPIAAALAQARPRADSNAFAVRLLQRLRDLDDRTIPALAWLDERLAARGTNADEAVGDENLRQGAATVTVSNIVNSLRMIGSADWNDIFEGLSLVEKALGADAGYADMDFATRNLYRSAVEELARGSALEEIDIARRAVAAGGGRDADSSDRGRGAGSHLVGAARATFERDIAFRPKLPKRLASAMRRFGLPGYLAAIALCGAAFLAGAIWALSLSGISSAWLAVLAILALIPISDSAVSLVNCLVTHAIGPAVIPALELKDGIPASARTLVAVPTLLTSPESVAERLEGLEVHYLGSPEGEVYFALLSDFADAASQEALGDAALLEAAARGVDDLNARYGPGSAGERFVLLHRARSWSAGESDWIGWERKRGKLHQLNRFLRGAQDTGFLAVDGAPPRPPGNVRYVITLDSDTRLPRESVRRLIGKMAHPLNAPEFDAVLGRVVEGYGVLQPRITASLPSGGAGSLFQRIFSPQNGIDPYSAAISDVYQDLFKEGSFAGKGIYDIDAFESSLAGRVPEAAMLSHDLFEGVFARAGLASDVEVVEDFPARYDVAALRQHRWARGDWQLLPWIFGKAGPGSAARAVPAIGRWKMIDNLRRSLSPPLAAAALLEGWRLPFHAALAWTALMVAAIMTPSLIPVFCGLRPARAGVPLRAHLRTLTTDFSFALTQSVFVVVFLADQAWLMADAISRTLWRLFVSRKRLLEWVSHAQTEVGARPNIWAFSRRMAGAYVIGLLAAIDSLAHGGENWPVAGPFALLWLASPGVAFWASLPPAAAGRRFRALWEAFPALARWASLSPLIAGELPTTPDEARFLRLVARKTWRFFETFVTPGDNFLPPDNFQEDPAPVVAHRTSPTNIGLYLLSVASARDFGWIGTLEAVERCEATFATMRKMERVRGHLYNWYDTQTLRPLEPLYISSVDSGNLAGHLIAMARACAEWAAAPLDAATIAAGIADAVDLAKAQVEALQEDQGAGSAWKRRTLAALAEIAAEAAPGELAVGGHASRLLRLASLADALGAAIPDPARALGRPTPPALSHWLQAIKATIQSHLRDARPASPEAPALGGQLKALEDSARRFALAMEFGFLLDQRRKLLSIGYLVHEDELDSNCYDLVASEARLASFFAIAKGDVPARHWFRLGRAVTLVEKQAALISWSGSMFEYLMPSIVMQAPTGSLIEQTSRLIVRRQIDYGTALGVPWGISESAYNVRDLEYTYQYSNFGVPGLGLKRGLDANVVVAPYATALAAMVDPRAAVKNFARLERIGGLGSYGFYEALDFTPVRLPDGESVAIVKSHMAHHQGMAIAAIANALLNAPMRRRFHAEPLVQATELLLQERPPRDVAVTRQADAFAKSVARIKNFDLQGGRRITTADSPSPATLLLSNGQYSVMLTGAGSGYSRWRDMAVVRWREDATRDDWGNYVFLRDLDGGEAWSATYQPHGTAPKEYEAVFNEDRATYTRRDGVFTTTMEVLVSGEDDAEVRHVTLVNSSREVREVEITSYAELSLAPQAADLAHPAFSKLFVETEYIPELDALVATRRRRAPGEAEIWAAHLAVIDGEAVGAAEYETDRARFLGRNREVGAAIAEHGAHPLSNSAGIVLDAIFSVRRKVRVAPGGMARVSFWTMVAPSREALLNCVDKHRDGTAFGRAATLAWSQAQVLLHHIGVDPTSAATFQRLAGHLLFAGPALRASSDAISRGAGSQSGLWGLSVSGDLPILLLRISDAEHLELARHLLLAQEYLRLKRFHIDLVIMNERGPSYFQDLQSGIEGLVRTSQSRRSPVPGVTGSVFVVRSDLMAAETRALLLSVSRVVLVGQRGSLAQQLDSAPSLPLRRSTPSARPRAAKALPAPPTPPLELFNGYGGFADAGREYVVILGPGMSTPAPWINVVANANFGFLASAEGGGYTWSLNSRDNQLTPWANDPVEDRPGEAIYLRDEDTGEVWSAAAQPARDPAATYLARHGWGYSRFEHTSRGIAVELTQFVPISDSVKISRLTLRNSSGRTRRLSVTSYVEWVLGASRSGSAPFVATSLDPSTGAIFARNLWAPAVAGRVAFFDMGGRQNEWTGDRREFIGRNQTLANPAAMSGPAPLSGAVGAGLDPCAAMRASIVLPSGGAIQLVTSLGQAASVEDARSLVARYRAADCDAILDEVRGHWDRVLGTVQVHTPDRAMEIMLNGWLLYQTLACRVWARAALYQASGAYGFRDQLQDGMALATSAPELTREHLLRAAARQFREGDVQHWWFPNTGLGVRTRISDDRAWLAYATSHYVAATGDAKILDEQAPFLEGQWLKENERESLFQAMASDANATLFEHCALALDHSLGFGVHGLPLIGSGDWNDGMNRVGENGQGESVWLAWLLCAALAALAPHAEARGQAERAEKWRVHVRGLRAALDGGAWDGEWYVRGYYDDGGALGSSSGDECQIDSIAQSWAVLSGAGDPRLAKRAMASLERELIRPADGLALLFKPPFDKTVRDPGYIKGYPPGIRENGGQYTHAAAWSVIAFAALGEGEKAAHLFSLLNPINHALTREDAQRYAVEPYVVAADVYAAEGHVGRGGWTWYTGSAGWMQRAGVEHILGVKVLAGTLVVDPCIPADWPGFGVKLKHGSALYEITIENPGKASRGVAAASLDGTAVGARPVQIPLRDDGERHVVLITLG